MSSRWGDGAPSDAEGRSHPWPPWRDGAGDSPESWATRRTPPVWKIPAIVLVIAVVGTLLAADKLAGYRPLDARAWLLLCAGPLALAARRRAPVLVALIVAGTMSAYYLLGYPAGPEFVPELVALNGVILAARRWVAWTIAGVGYTAFTIAEYTIGVAPRLPAGALLAAAAWTALVLVGAEAGRAARERGAEIMRRRAEVEQRRKEAELRRVSDERLRIAREVHDLLGHHLSLINVQSGVALHLMDARSAPAPGSSLGPGSAPGTAAVADYAEDAERAQLRAALAAIKQASKDALVELRATVNTLRGVDEDAPRQPAPTLDRLDDLLGRAGVTGVEVRTETTGERIELSPRVDLAAFRIVQEALTNVRRHAGPVPATVTLAYGERTLVVQIDDDGPATEHTAPVDHSEQRDEAPTGGGNGIPGMRERAQSVGGVLRAGPRPGGGFRVRAEFPLDDV